MAYSLKLETLPTVKHLKIGIIEDDLLIAESIVVALKQIGYHPTLPARNYANAVNMVEAESPDLLLIDVMLEGEQDGIDFALEVNKRYGIPFIFLTALSDQTTVNRAKKANPYAYLVKPFNEQDLYSSIEIAFNNHNQQVKSIQPKSPSPGYLDNVIFIKQANLFHKIEIGDILYLESDNVYLNIFATKNHYVVRTKLDDFIKELPPGDFLRVHRSYAVNVRHLETINSLNIIVAGKEIPVHKTYRQAILQRIKSLS